MSHAPISITLLIDPTSSKNGKFYIGVDDDRCPLTAHGPASRGATGTWANLGSAAAVRKKINEKQRKSYSSASVSAMPLKVIERLFDQIGQELGLAPNSMSISNGFITFNGAGASGSGTGKPRKPRRRNAQSINVWI